MEEVNINQNKRINLSKKIRFEVFKRDKFICQYCGGKAPDVLLHVDHIEPVAKGGGNEIVNLITSCQGCNLGKKDRRLEDNTVLDKQRKQMELLQERREQIGLMFKWKKSLSKLDDETVQMIKDYADTKLPSGKLFVAEVKNDFKNLLRKYSVTEVLDAIDISAERYLRFSDVGNILDNSADTFIKKIGGILYIQSLSPIDQKLSFIKNKANKAFNYFDSRIASIILNQYVSALKKYWHYDDEAIIADLENELVPKLEECRNWSEWKEQIEAWTESIKEKKIENKEEREPLSPEVEENLLEDEIQDILNSNKTYLEGSIKVLVHILSPFSEFNKDTFVMSVYKTIRYLLSQLKDIPKEDFLRWQKESMFGVVQEYACEPLRNIIKDLDPENKDIDFILLDRLQGISIDILEKLFEKFFFSPFNYTQHDANYLIDYFCDYIDYLIKNNIVSEITIGKEKTV